MAKVKVHIFLKPGVLDVQGKAVEGALKGLGWCGVADVRVGKLIEFDYAGDNVEAEVNALQQDWTAALLDIEMEEGGKPMAYANPPYWIAQDENGGPLTGMRRIMAKAAEERDRGAASIWLVKSATSENWWPAKPFDEEEGVQADTIIFITGRIAFEPPVWYRPDEGVSPPTSAGFGAAILVFDKNIDPELKKLDDQYLSRAWLQSLGAPAPQIEDDEL